MGSEVVRRKVNRPMGNFSVFVGMAMSKKIFMFLEYFSADEAGAVSMSVFLFGDERRRVS